MMGSAAEAAERASWWASSGLTIILAALYPTVFVVSQNWYALSVWQSLFLVAAAAVAGVVVFAVVEGAFRVAGWRPAASGATHAGPCASHCVGSRLCRTDLFSPDCHAQGHGPLHDRARSHFLRACGSVRVGVSTGRSEIRQLFPGCPGSGGVLNLGAGCCRRSSPDIGGHQAGLREGHPWLEAEYLSVHLRRLRQRGCLPKGFQDRQFQALQGPGGARLQGRPHVQQLRLYLADHDRHVPGPTSLL